MGKLWADVDFVGNIDGTNYRPAPKTDEQGRVTLPALIPGAIYRIDSHKNDKVLKEFSVKPGEQLDLGDIAIDP